MKVMKIKKTLETTDHYTVELTAGDTLYLKVRGTAFGLAFDIASLRLNFYLTGSLLSTPVFSISYSDLIAMDENIAQTAKYINLTIPSQFYSEVKKRLSDLPIPLPNQS
jgi:hypothetical protein